MTKLEEIAQFVCKDRCSPKCELCTHFEDYVPIVESVLKALRNSTPAMLQAAWAVINSKKTSLRERFGTGPGFIEAYQSAIDVLLEEKP
jgi:hypothetical protein